MALTVPNQFSNQLGPIPLSQLDANFSALVNFINAGSFPGLVVGPPTSGTTLLVQAGATGTSGIGITSTAGSMCGISLNQAGQSSVILYNPASTNDFRINIGGVDRFVMNSSGTVGVATCAVKAGDSAPIINSTTPVNDVELHVALNAGNYMYELLAFPVQGGAGAVGINCNINYSGTYTATTSLNACDLFGTTTTSANVGVVSTQSAIALSLGAFNSVRNGWVRIQGALTATGSGTLGFAWAQNTSSATTLTLCGGSYLKVTPLK